MICLKKITNSCHGYFQDILHSQFYTSRIFEEEIFANGPIATWKKFSRIWVKVTKNLSSEIFFEQNTAILDAEASVQMYAENICVVNFLSYA